MAALDDLNAAVTGAMQGDQLAEQQLLSHLQMMNQTLTAAAPIFETARQIPIATTLGRMNLAQSRYYNEGLLPLRQEELVQQKIETPGIQSRVSTQMKQNQLTDILTDTAIGVADFLKNNPGAQSASKNAALLKTLLDEITTRTKVSESRALESGAPGTAVLQQTRVQSEAKAAAAEAEERYQEARQLTSKPFGLLPSLTQRRTIAEARAAIARPPLETEGLALRTRAAAAELLPLETAVNAYTELVKTDPARARQNLYTDMAKVYGARAGFGNTVQSVQGQIAYDIRYGTPEQKAKAQQALIDLDSGIQKFNYFKQQGLIPLTVDGDNLYGVAYGLALAGEDAAARVVGDMAQNLNYQRTRAEEQEIRQSGYGVAAYFRKATGIGGDTIWLAYNDYKDLKPAAISFINDLLPYDTPDMINNVALTASRLHGQSHLHRAVGYGVIPRAVSLAKQHESDEWLTGDKKLKSLVYGINTSIPYHYTRLFPQAIPTAKAIAANYITPTQFEDTEKSLKADIEFIINTLTVNKPLSMRRAMEILMSQVTTPQQIEAFNQAYPGLGRQLQGLTNTYLNLTLNPLNRGDVVPEANMFSTELGMYAPIPSTPPPKERLPKGRTKQDIINQLRVSANQPGVDKGQLATRMYGSLRQQGFTEVEVIDILTQAGLR